MQEISQKSQNLSKISKFCEIEILHHIDNRKIAITRLILKIHGGNFVCRPNFDKGPLKYYAVGWRGGGRPKYDIVLHGGGG